MLGDTNYCNKSKALRELLKLGHKTSHKIVVSFCLQLFDTNWFLT